jgi:hypothetical protein
MGQTGTQNDERECSLAGHTGLEVGPALTVSRASSATGLGRHGGHMKTLSLGQAARLREHGKTIFARAISGRFFAGSKEDGGSNVDGAESGRVYPFPAPVETAAELRSRLALAEERLTELKAMLEDMRRDRDAWREQAQTRMLPAPAAPTSWWRWRRTVG